MPQVLQLLREALHRRPLPWRALQGVALCLMHFGPKAIKEAPRQEFDYQMMGCTFSASSHGESKRGLGGPIFQETDGFKRLSTMGLKQQLMGI